MFTGIIETTGVVKKMTEGRISVEARAVVNKLRLGTSIAVNGACLTVAAKTATGFTADVMPETLKKTTLGRLQTGSLVNLELAMPASGRFEGHIVTGHVEGVGKITAIRTEKNSRLLTIAVPKALLKFIIPKGSVALNGISLTVIGVTRSGLSVGIIPHTWAQTNLHTLRVGSPLNIETDVLARQLEKFSRPANR